MEELVNIGRLLGKITHNGHSALTAARLATVCTSRKDLEAIYKVLQLEKVVLPAYKNLQYMNSHYPNESVSALLEEIQQEYNQRCEFSLNIMPLIRESVGQILQDAGIRFVFIKGSSLEEYPDGYIRQMNDLDILIETWDDLFRAAAALKMAGYDHGEVSEAPWIKCIHDDIPLSPQSMLAHINLSNRVNGHFINLDLHSAPFEIGPIGFLKHNLWQRTAKNSLFRPSVEDRLLILVAHAVNHGYFLVKDFNDVYAMLRSQNEYFDWDYFLQYSKNSTIEYACWFVLNYVSQNYENHQIPLQVLIQLNTTKSNIGTYVIQLNSQATKDQSRRVWSERLMYLIHIYLHETAKGVPYYALIRQAWQFINWSFRLTILQGKWGDQTLVQRILHKSKSLLQPIPRRGEQILIVPLQNIIDDSPRDLERYLLVNSTKLNAHLLSCSPPICVTPIGHTVLFFTQGNAELIITPIDTFVPTTDGIFNDTDIRDLSYLTEYLVANLKFLN